MRVLVTGHQGYLGSVVVPRLLDAGHDVVGLDVGFFRDCTVGPPPPEVRGLDLDVRAVAREHLEELELDAVIHLAALCNDPLGNLSSSLTDDINHLASVRLAEVAKSAGVTRFLFASSCSLYGAGDTEALLDETADFAPVTPYGESKVFAERDLLALADDDFSPVFLRNATAYGFSPRLRGDLVVNDLVGHALLMGEVRLMSDGRAWRPLVHADDIASAFIALLGVSRERIHGRAFNVGQTSENYLIRDVAEIVRERVGGTVTYASGASADTRNYRVSCDLIAEEIPEFQPQWTVAKGVDELAARYEELGLTLEALMGEPHQRVKRIRALLDAGRIDQDLRWTEG